VDWHIEDACSKLLQNMVTMCQLIQCHVPEDLNLQMLGSCILCYFFPPVAAKHKETKQFYTLYNTLDDKKLYFSKELTLLNSILDNYTE
jgi:hypothetical protein